MIRYPHTKNKEILITRIIYPRTTLREESSQTNVILQYKLLASILSAICNVIQQSYTQKRFCNITVVLVVVCSTKHSS